MVWFENEFLAQTPYGQPPTRVTARDKTSFDEAGFEFQEPLVEQVKVPRWYETEMLPKPLRHGEGGHDGSHPFLTHEFIDACCLGAGRLWTYMRLLRTRRLELSPTNLR